MGRRRYQSTNDHRRHASRRDLWTHLEAPAWCMGAVEGAQHKHESWGLGPSISTKTSTHSHRS